MTSLPRARGPLSAAVIESLVTGSVAPVRIPSVEVDDALADDDLQLALRVCYDLHYTSFEGVDPAREWDPELLRFRWRLERMVMRALEDVVGPADALRHLDPVEALQELATADGPSLSSYLAHEGTRVELTEFIVHRSAYQLKEADPHTWAIPRLRGAAKAAMITIQYDEYGCGTVEGMHAELFAATMQAFGLDSSYGAYVEALPGPTLATDNLPTLFGLHRAWAAACVGHLALFEMTSVGPMSRYSSALARHGFPTDARRFYDVHLEADTVHEKVALEDMVRGLLDDDPTAAGTVIFGARSLAEVERRFTDHLLGSWHDHRSSLHQSVVQQAGDAVPAQPAPLARRVDAGASTSRAHGSSG